MALATNKELKLYYSIGEVAKMFNVSETLLRFWEKQFPQISPRKSGRNIRQYSKEDIEEKCYAIRGRNASMNFSLNNNQMTVRMPVEKEVRGDEDEPYGGVFKRYGIGR